MCVYLPLEYVCLRYSNVRMYIVFPNSGAPTEKVSTIKKLYTHMHIRTRTYVHLSILSVLTYPSISTGVFTLLPRYCNFKGL